MSFIVDGFGIVFGHAHADRVSFSENLKIHSGLCAFRILQMAELVTNVFVADAARAFVPNLKVFG